MDSDLSLDFLRVVEQAAIACGHTMGQGDGHKADQAAVESMRSALDTVPIDGTIVIGEGERDEAPMLFIGEKVGIGARDPSARALPQVDIAAYLATSPETVSRSFRQLREMGIIAMSRHAGLVIRDRQRLEAIASAGPGAA